MIDQILITDMTQDEWTESAENEPTKATCSTCGKEFPADGISQCWDCWWNRGGDNADND